MLAVAPSNTTAWVDVSPLGYAGQRTYRRTPTWLPASSGIGELGGAARSPRRTERILRDRTRESSRPSGGRAGSAITDGFSEKAAEIVVPHSRRGAADIDPERRQCTKRSFADRPRKG